MSQTGTLYLKAVATDTATQTINLTTTMPVNSSYNGQPSLLAAASQTSNPDRNGTYNYGAAWMLDTNHKVWWTSMYPGGGDQIVQASGANPPGTTTPTTAVATDSNSTHYISNPCVIKSSVTYNSTSYAYVMYVTEWAGGSGAGIGMSFSNNGTTWTTPVHILDTDYSTGDDLGISSVIKFSDKWVMFTNDRFAYGDSGAIVLGYRESSDGVTWPSSASTIVTQDGFSSGTFSNAQANGSNAVFSHKSGYWYVVYTSTDSVRVYRKSDSTSLNSGTWSQVVTVPYNISFAQKHNAGFLVDTNGVLYGSNVTFSFSGNKSTGVPTDQGNDIDESQLYYVSYTP